MSFLQPSQVATLPNLVFGQGWPEVFSVKQPSLPSTSSEAGVADQDKQEDKRAWSGRGPGPVELPVAPSAMSEPRGDQLGQLWTPPPVLWRQV